MVYDTALDNSSRYVMIIVQIDDNKCHHSDLLLVITQVSISMFYPAVKT